MPQGLRNMLILGQLRIAERHKTKHGHVYSRRDFKNHQCERCGAGLILPEAGFFTSGAEIILGPGAGNKF